jgi:coenzyme F420 hydrogenase subunit beta
MAIELDRTIWKVAETGLCTGCGTCVGLCPQDAIKMIIDKPKGIYAPQLDKEGCNECGVCVDVCPGHSVDFKRLNRDIFGKEPEDILLGNYLHCYLGHATDYEVRYNAASGGLVSALLIFALEEGLIDGALVTKMNIEHPLETQTFIARSREEIISAAESKYCPVPANIALKEILSAEEGKRFAVVGLPCHIQGIRKAEAIDEKLKAKIALHLGLFCNHTPSLWATENLLYQAKVKREEIAELHYRGEGWPGKMRIGLKTGEDVFIKFPDYWFRCFGQFFYPKRCLLCCDQGNELADISFGDPWGVEEGDDIGTSLIISRSEIGESFLQKAAAKNVKLQVIDRDRIQGVGLRQRAEAGIRLYKLLGKPVPLYNRETLKPGLKTYLKAAGCYLQEYLGSKRKFWPLIPRLISLAGFLRVGKALQ